MLQLNGTQVAAMRAAMDRAAAHFWAYPDEEWQANFQSDWLDRQFGVSRAQGPDGLVWGTLDPEGE